MKILWGMQGESCLRRQYKRPGQPPVHIRATLHRRAAAIPGARHGRRTMQLAAETSRQCKHNFYEVCRVQVSRHVDSEDTVNPQTYIERPSQPPIHKPPCTAVPGSALR